MLISSKKILKMQHGFSLTELSIVIVIIALLLSAILKGQNLINEAKLQAIISEVSNNQVAVNSFYAKYTKYPGDFNAAVAYWGDITENGDNNGRIEFKNNEGTPVYEGYRLWQHLAYAGMVGSPYLGTATTSAATMGTDVPLSKSGGGYLFDYSSSGSAYDKTTAGAYGMLARNIILLGLPLATTSSPIKANGVLTPNQAMGIDEKIDDGVPTTGSVMAADGNGSTTGNCVSATVYNISLAGKDCMMIFKVANQ
jgi:prepilin-type N-terminal cleavage/methylation domain-containing protein